MKIFTEMLRNIIRKYKKDEVTIQVPKGYRHTRLQTVTSKKELKQVIIKFEKA